MSRITILFATLFFAAVSSAAQEVRCGCTEEEVVEQLGPPTKREETPVLTILTYRDLDGTRTYLILSSSGLQQVNLNGETVKDCRKPQNLVTPPTPLRMIPLPGDLPASVRGLTVDVLVFVNEAGTVDSVALNPPTPDQRFNARLMRVAVLVKFEPADSAGQAVPMWFKWTWRF